MRRTRVYRFEGDDGPEWAVVYWPDPFDMDFYTRKDWREAITLAFKLERER